MAKSLRSKKVLKAKSIKRNKEFQVMEDKRKQRLAEKMQKELEEQKGADEKTEDETMKVDTKISTSGWRDSGKLRYKQRKSSKKKSKALKF